MKSIMKNNKYLSDADLVIKYQKGEKIMLAFLVKRWHIQFCKFAFWVVKDADIAKDIAQESWTKIMNKIDDLQEPEKFKSWAISIVNRIAIDFIRAKNRERIKLEKHFLDSEKEDLICDESDNLIIKKELLKSIEKLSKEHQMIIQLFYQQSYSLKEISEILQISVGTIKSRLFHAREKLKITLKNNNYER